MASNKQQHRQRDLLDSLANLFNGSAKAGGDSSSSSGANTDNTDNTSSTTETSSDSQTPTSTSSTSSDDSHSSSSSRTSKHTTTSDSKGESSTPTDSSPSSSPDPTSDSSSDSSSSFVLVTVTRPNSVVTTSVARPTIDDANGDKANVGGSSNLTTIIVAPVVTSLALLFCAVMLFLYIRRKNRNKYNNEDVFAKGASHSGARDNSMSPFIPQGHDSGDGYVKEEDNGPVYSAPPVTAAAAAAVAPMATHGARPGEYYVANNAAADTHLLANPRYQQNAGAYTQPAPINRYQTQPLQQQQQQQFAPRPPVLSTAPTAPPIPAPLGRYGAGPQLTSYQQQQAAAAGYRGNAANAQYGNGYAPPNSNSNEFRY
ncbi:hypothetical protein GGI23_002622 [Coemansia sp. RSA 2559]|nr:hypothetical protein GGI23_002622 [Coemansia sp. RSA 2559]